MKRGYGKHSWEIMFAVHSLVYERRRYGLVLSTESSPLGISGGDAQDPSCHLERKFEQHEDSNDGE